MVKKKTRGQPTVAKNKDGHYIFTFKIKAQVPEISETGLFLTSSHPFMLTLSTALLLVRMSFFCQGESVAAIFV